MCRVNLVSHWRHLRNNRKVRYAGANLRRLNRVLLPTSIIAHTGGNRGGMLIWGTLLLLRDKLLRVTKRL